MTTFTTEDRIAAEAIQDYAEPLLQQMAIIKKLHNALLKKNFTDAYLIACDNTEIAQNLEDIAQLLAHKYGK